MSRAYRFSLRIRGYVAGKEVDIEAAANEEWSFDEWGNDGNGLLWADGEGSLCGGCSDDEMATRLTHAIWKANGQFCVVDVCATYMEDLPYENYELDEDDYEQWQQQEQPPEAAVTPRENMPRERTG